MIGNGRRGRAAGFVFVMAGLCLAGAGVQQMRGASYRPMFWLEGDCWTSPTHCLYCGGQLHQIDPHRRGCAACQLTIALPDSDP